MCVSVCVGATPQPTARFHTVIFADTYDPRLVLPQATAFQFGMRPWVVGLGDEVTQWGYGSSAVWNVERSFVFNETQPHDVVLIVDAYDVMFQAGEEELLNKFIEIEARTGRAVIYSSDPLCSSERQAEFPPSDTVWRYVNGGVVIGRSWALRKLFAKPLPHNMRGQDGKPKRLQNWHIDFYLDNLDLVMVDSNCEIAQTIINVPNLNTSSSLVPGNIPGEALDLVMSNGKIRNPRTNTTPPILHFAGPGHWPDSCHPLRTGTCVAYEVFRQMKPGLTRIMEERASKAAQPPPWKPICSSFISVWDDIGLRIGRIGDRIIRCSCSGFSPGLLLAALGFCVPVLLVCGRASIRNRLAEYLPVRRHILPPTGSLKLV